ncbi:septum site-determining protein MinC [Catenovulum sp. SM1970]|uniref:septum site-determining protein MinC n=1 Tax=Marinifaba aquimaris TaxID=2741323 RepID=UPI001572904A|nr:septum site-determining protein MinC [Marinifaba aquimaris]NTS78176.1 septum site-determining protein MinC [Marinifaba aquimaris]
MSETAIELKGSGFTLSVLHIATNDIAAITAALDAKISQAPSFFAMAPIVVNLEKLAEQTIDFVALKEALVALNLVPVGVTAATDEQKVAAKEAGLAVMIAAKQTAAPTQEVKVERVEVPVEVPVAQYVPAMVVKTNVRSGQQIYAKGTDLIVHGAVSNGGEVIADGNIHIYGTLRGKAAAGAQGDQNARIYAQNIQAELVSISGNYWTSEQIQEHRWQQSGCIHLDGEQLTISSLQE